jgi:hypothetical protein
MVRAVVTTGKKAGTFVGRVAVRASGSFNIQTKSGTIQGLHYRFFTLLHRVDGYQYDTPRREEPPSAPCLKAGVSGGEN